MTAEQRPLAVEQRGLAVKQCGLLEGRALSRRPLGLVIIGGLVFSQMVTLFVTPVIYLWLEWFQEHVLGKVPFLRSAHFHESHEPGAGPDYGEIEPATADIR